MPCLRASFTKCWGGNYRPVAFQLKWHPPNTTIMLIASQASNPGQAKPYLRITKNYLLICSYLLIMCYLLIVRYFALPNIEYKLMDNGCICTIWIPFCVINRYIKKNIITFLLFCTGNITVNYCTSLRPDISARCCVFDTQFSFIERVKIHA